MTSNSSILIDKSLLSRLDQGLYKIESIFALISGLAVFSLMMLAVISVTGRHTINQPLPGYVDWIEQAMPLIAFMGVAYTQRNGGHIRMDILVSFLRKKLMGSRIHNCSFYAACHDTYYLGFLGSFWTKL